MGRRIVMLALLVLGLVLLAGCGADDGDGAAGSERQEIQNIVRDYLSQDANTPAYTVDVAEVEDEWALARARPEGVETEPVLFILKKLEPGEVAPEPAAAAPDAATVTPGPPTQQPPAATRTSAETGWVVVLGPQLSFSDEELDRYGVPDDLYEN